MSNTDNDLAGSFTSIAYNLIGDGEPSFIDGTEYESSFTGGVKNDHVGTSESPIDANLGPLADNGSPTPTHTLLPGSPAIDAGTCTLSDQPTISSDQRAFPRPIDLPDVANVSDGCDIGAFESQLASLSISKSAFPDPVAAGGTLTYTLSKTNSGPGVAQDVVVTDTLPLSVTYGSVVTASVVFSQPTPSIPVWNVKALQPGEYTVVFTATVGSSVTGSITNTAVISSTTARVDFDGLRTTHTDEMLRREDVYLPAIQR